MAQLCTQNVEATYEDEKEAYFIVRTTDETRMLTDSMSTEEPLPL
jgi:hypothetical protein